MTRPILLILSVMVISCCKEQKPAPVVERKAPVQRKAIKTDPISLEITSEMMSDALAELPLEKLMRDEALGGYFLKAPFDIRPPFKGVLLWSCYNPNRENDLPKFFLAVEQVTAYDSVNPEKNVPGARLTVPLDVFKYTETASDDATALSYIRRHETKKSGTITTVVIPGSKVKEYSDNFALMMKAFQIVSGKLYSKYPQAFFLYNTAYRNFLTRNPYYVRYYMGVRMDEDHQPNYFRPILGGAFQNGTTIETKDTRGDEPFLQKSVPPPPIL